MLRGVLVALSILLLFGTVVAIQLLISRGERSQKAAALAAYAAARGMTPVPSGETLMRSWNQSVLNMHASIGGTFNGLRVEVLLSGMRRGWRRMTVVARCARAASLPTIGVHRSMPREGASSPGAPAPPNFSDRFTLSGPPALAWSIVDADSQRRIASFPRDIDSVWLENGVAGMQWVENDPVDPAIVDSALDLICSLCARGNVT